MWCPGVVVLSPWILLIAEFLRPEELSSLGGLDKVIMVLSFGDSSKSANTVNRLLDNVFPGHSTAVTKIGTSGAQIINTAQKKLKPEEVRRIQKKEKLAQRHQMRQKQQVRAKVESVARYDLLKQHAKDGKLTPDEKKELKILVNKNVVSLQSWRTDAEDEMVDIQREILELKKKDSSKKRSKKKVTAQEIYKKKQEQKYPGLTPGLAPVGMSDSDSDDE